MSRFGLYLHVPFCRSKCVYCDFPSYPHMEKWHDAVIRRMIGEFRQQAVILGHRPPTTVYVGGGTPSILAPERIERLMTAAREAFPWNDGAEVSVEMNPGTVTGSFVSAALRCGVNRVSLGAQSASDRLLTTLGRIHTFEETRNTVQLLRDRGIININLDMMIGLPEQTIDDVRETLSEFIALDPAHISCYSLILEPGTPLYDAVQHGDKRLPDEAEERQMYYLARSTLESAGYRQYEISNFARPGRECRHNLDCWHREEYLGIGVSAASLLGSTRYRNPASVSAYLQGQAPERIELSAEDERFESVMLGLRLNEGLSDREFHCRHGKHLNDVFGDVISRLVAGGLLEWQGDALKCTERGFDIQNDVLTEFL